MSQPIADLSYRTYDGPRTDLRKIWWVIARAHILTTFTRKAYWGVMGLSAWYFLAFVVIMSFLERIAVASDPRLLQQFVERLNFGDQPLLGFTISMLPMMVLTMMVCSGAIANDRRSNALLVYLSKPCSQWDYLMGKLVGCFVPIFLAFALPGTLFYGLGALSYRQYGFLDNPWVLPSMLVTYFVTALFFTSLALALSALVKQPRIAGALFACVFLISGMFSQIMYTTWTGAFSSGGTIVRDSTLSRLTYASLDGTTIAFAKSILQTNGSDSFMRGRLNQIDVPYMPLWIPCIIITVIVSLSLFTIWRKVKAVEVIA